MAVIIRKGKLRLNMIQQQRRFSFPRSERLKYRSIIDQLFAEGTAINDFPVQVMYLYVPNAEHSAVQVGFAVPKRLIRKAADRVKIKRLMREAYRLQKAEIHQSIDRHAGLYLMFIYKAKTIPTYRVVEGKIKTIIERL
ncbi:MAG: ribonuclease P protein component, partial [Salinivirgaceae bacterium]